MGRTLHTSIKKENFIKDLKRIVTEEVQAYLDEGNFAAMKETDEEPEKSRLPIAKMDMHLLVKLLSQAKEVSTDLEMKNIVANIIRLARGGETLTLEHLPTIIPKKEEQPVSQPKAKPENNPVPVAKSIER